MATGGPDGLIFAVIYSFIPYNRSYTERNPILLNPRKPLESGSVLCSLSIFRLSVDRLDG